MRDFEVVDYPRIWPQKCVICTNQKGSMIDTFSETLDGRVYICKPCVKRMSEHFGLAPGEQLDKLMDASRLQEEAERGMAQKDELIAKYREKQMAMTAANKQLNEELEVTRGQLDQKMHYAKQLTALAQDIGG
jgi:hypothetical protein